MKKLLLIVMLLAFPFQVSWSAVGTYCQHEQEVGGNHFGHHEHQHRVAADDNQDHDSTMAKKPHADCSYCSMNGAAMAVSSAEAPAFSAHSIPLPIEFPCQLSQLVDRPERPQWLLAIA